jgi:hypothetical protein
VVIYEAQRISDGMPVAIKLLRAAAAHDGVVVVSPYVVARSPVGVKERAW